MDLFILCSIFYCGTLVTWGLSNLGNHCHVLNIQYCVCQIGCVWVSTHLCSYILLTWHCGKPLYCILTTSSFLVWMWESWIKPVDIICVGGLRRVCRGWECMEFSAIYELCLKWSPQKYDTIVMGGKWQFMYMVFLLYAQGKHPP